MLKNTLIAVATAAVLTGTALAPAAAATSGYIEVKGPGSWNGPGQWQGPRHGHRGYKHRGPRRSCEPVIRWKKVGFRHHRRWQPIVVGWDCNYGKAPHHWRKQ